MFFSIDILGTESFWDLVEHTRSSGLEWGIFLRTLVLKKMLILQCFECDQIFQKIEEKSPFSHDFHKFRKSMNFPKKTGLTKFHFDVFVIF